MQVTDEVCTVCGKHYETGDSMDPNENENHNYEMCHSCYNADHVVHVSVYGNHKGNKTDKYVTYEISETYVDIYNPNWVSFIRENITRGTFVVGLTDPDFGKKVDLTKVEDEGMKFLLSKGFVLITD